MESMSISLLRFANPFFQPKYFSSTKWHLPKSGRGIPARHSCAHKGLKVPFTQCDLNTDNGTFSAARRAVFRQQFNGGAAVFAVGGDATADTNQGFAKPLLQLLSAG